MASSSCRYPLLIIGVLAILVPAIVFRYNEASNIALWSSASPVLKTATTLRTAGETLFYYHYPNKFVRNILECLHEGPHCHMLYWHIQKTGGSLLASRLYPAYNMGEWYNSKKWCCNQQFMKNKFWPNVTKYCSMKLGVYEVRPKEYVDVIHACQDFRKKEFDNNSTVTSRRHRYIGFVSIREPIQRSISAIHQRCNVHRRGLSKETHAICERCSYEEDKEFYQDFVNETNIFYSTLKDSILSDSSIDIPLYIIDNEQIDDFFWRMENLLNKEVAYLNGTFHFPRGKSNSEKPDKLCDFGMTSELMRQHNVSLEAYHWLWSGGYSS